MSDFSAFGLNEDEEFIEASDFVRRGAFDISTEHQLKFYAYFKQATVGPCNTPRPGFFSGFADTAKWDAWKALESVSKSEAKLQYVALLDTLQPEWKFGKATGKKPSWTVVSTMGGDQEHEKINEEDKTICDRVSDGDVEIVEDLLRQNPTLVNFKDEGGMTGLHWAADGGNLALIELFLNHGANPNDQDEEGQTALHFAVICEHHEAASLLVARGADPNIQDLEGNTPTSLAKVETWRS
eukprot:TRINITY_DN3299_c0_g1_i2.p2 TRINITY_DN3299_c0_g1~~TRINITY_DN3299_c0_g1_i2.p2  ORF type:complete len:240 (-),score=54.50 TRINITY_DN3299_c0_g1_i2:159-878(-)